MTSGLYDSAPPSPPLPPGYSTAKTPDMVWWEAADLPTVEYIDVADLNIPPPHQI